MIIAVDFDGTCVTHEFPYDAALGVPLKQDSLSERPYVDWDIVKYHLHAKNIL